MSASSKALAGPAVRLDTGDQDRRQILHTAVKGLAAAGAANLFPLHTANAAVPGDAIRRYHIDIPQRDLDDLRRRVRETRWPDRETVPDQSQGVQLATLQALAKYWGKTYDWRKIEARLNALPQFVSEIDGLDIHFIHVRSKNPDALPVIITHGWPGSVIELIKVIGPLTDPVAHGGRAEDAFHVVIPSMPGYGFSGKPKTGGWDPEHIARAWDVLMKRLGYVRYVSQGGDWGAAVVNAMARQAPSGLLGIHSNLPATIPPEIGKALANGEPSPAGLSEKEKAAYEQLLFLFAKGRGYLIMMGTHPQTLTGLADSPIGLASFLIDHDARSYQRIAGLFAGQAFGQITRDDILDNISLYWLTGTALSSARLYWENKSGSVLSPVTQKTGEIKLPVGVTVFPEELYAAPRSWTERAYPTLSYFHEADKGGHFAAWEQPELFAAELRAAFGPLRKSA